MGQVDEEEVWRMGIMKVHSLIKIHRWMKVHRMAVKVNLSSVKVSLPQAKVNVHLKTLEQGFLKGRFSWLFITSQSSKLTFDRLLRQWHER